MERMIEEGGRERGYRGEEGGSRGVEPKTERRGRRRRGWMSSLARACSSTGSQDTFSPFNGGTV